MIREVDTDSLRHLMSVAIDEHVFLQDGQTVTLDLEDAAAEGCAVEVDSQDETFVAPELGGGDVVAVEVAIDGSEQRFDVRGGRQETRTPMLYGSNLRRRRPSGH